VKRAPKSDTTERLIELEMKFMHQAALLDELSGVLYAQQTLVDRLDSRVKDLERRLADLGDPVPIEKPPHY
jgi:uncharacterized coiled-coil protein SlyX